MSYPRESVYPTTTPDLLAHLDDCVAYTEASAASLGESLRQFEPGVRDLPRLSKVLANRHHYLVLPAPQIQAQQSQLAASLAPQIETLISKAEHLIATQAARVANLEERLQILQSRQRPSASASAPPPSAAAGALAGEQENEEKDVDGPSYIADLPMRDLTVPQRRKVMMLRQKRAKLEQERREQGAR